MIKVPLNVAIVFNVKNKDNTTEKNSEHNTKDDSLGNNPDGDPPQSQKVLDLYAEWDTIETIDAVKQAIAEKHNVILIEADENAYEKLRALKPDIVFNIAEGLNGVFREAQIPAILELLQIPYTGSDPLTLGICLDKARTKEILSYYNIPTPHFALVSELSQLPGVTIDFPCIVKPQHEGSSKGIYNASVVHNFDQLIEQVNFIFKNYEQPALVEEFLEGREFTVAIMGNGSKVRVLPIVEIKFDSLPLSVNPIYSYEAKWIWDSSESPLEIFDCPANLSPSLQHEIESVCIKAYNVMRCRDWCRIDVRLDSRGVPNVLELNPLPGILPKPEDNSCFPKAARSAGMSYNQLIQEVLDLAVERYGIHKKNKSNGNK